MPDPTLLVVDELTVERGGRVVLAALSLRLHAGEAIHVTGRNGAGKSTLLRVLAGLLPTQAGCIDVAGASEEVRGVEMIHYLGYDDALKPALTVAENLKFWAAMLGDDIPPHKSDETRSRLRRWPLEWTHVSDEPSLSFQNLRTSDHPRKSAPFASDALEQRVGLSPGDALAAFGIGRLLDLPAGYLSAGQKRRVALARLLLNPRPIWLLDEPLIALDAAAQGALSTIMADHLGRGGGIIAASHAPLGLPCRVVAIGGPS